MKAHLSYYSLPYFSVVWGVVCFIAAVKMASNEPGVSAFFAAATVWFIIAAIINAVFLRALK